MELCMILKSLQNFTGSQLIMKWENGDLSPAWWWELMFWVSVWSFSLSLSLVLLHAILDVLTVLSRHPRDSAYDPLHPHGPCSRWQPTNRSEPSHPGRFLTLSVISLFYLMCWPCTVCSARKQTSSYYCIIIIIIINKSKTCKHCCLPSSS